MSHYDCVRPGGSQKTNSWTEGVGQGALGVRVRVSQSPGFGPQSEWESLRLQVHTTP